MAGQTELKRKIKSTSSTKKITSAMKMVSAAKLKKSQSYLTKLSKYARSINLITMCLVREVKKGFDVKCQSSYEKVLKVVSIEKRVSNKPKLVILCSPDKGLCGSLNTNIFKMFSITMRQDNFIVVPIGKKAYEFAKLKCPDKILDDSHLLQSKIFGIPDANKIAKIIVDLHIQDKISSSECVYASFVSAVKQVVKVAKITPLDVQEVSFNSEDRLDIGNLKEATFEFEPSAEQILLDIVSEELSGIIYYMVTNTITSEHAARMMAMENATKNADKMVKSLVLKYNRNRQASITKQILEIVSGINALS